jgi:hypothetical protein
MNWMLLPVESNTRRQVSLQVVTLHGSWTHVLADHWRSFRSLLARLVG